MFGKSNDEPASAPKDNTNTTVKEDDSVQSEFLDLAKEYSSTVEKMWKEENILCQDALDASKVVKPSELSESNSFGGTAYYYVFIDTDATDEIKLNVSNTKSVAGWVRVGKKDNSFYVALSDGKNYIVDKGDGQDVTAIETSDLKTSDVNTSGNGNNYQYKNGTIYGAASQGDGWRIGDAVVLNDSDTTNDGDYMSNGPKDGGYTPFCKNVE